MDGNGSGGCFPSDSYPNWLSYNSEGSSVKFEVPQVEGGNLKTMMCIFYNSTPDNVHQVALKTYWENSTPSSTQIPVLGELHSQDNSVLSLSYQATKQNPPDN
ncbi:hypothetical protein MTR_6g015655 [Medicago truncatula]|uniref:Uncharacterized protein n=1 Tax=Medicago truncatula TaxID=3880 RepID=A0A072U5S7_MEDTR|nr:hypothetical protein MTR_6g015655 [Medicago truncatula]